MENRGAAVAFQRKKKGVEGCWAFGLRWVWVEK